MNTDCMFSSKSDLWETPQDFFDELNREFHFNLDVCALPESAKCASYFREVAEMVGVIFVRSCRCFVSGGKTSA